MVCMVCNYNSPINGPRIQVAATGTITHNGVSIDLCKDCQSKAAKGEIPIWQLNAISRILLSLLPPKGQGKH